MTLTGYNKLDLKRERTRGRLPGAIAPSFLPCASIRA